MTTWTHSYNGRSILTEHTSKEWSNRLFNLLLSVLLLSSCFADAEPTESYTLLPAISTYNNPISYRYHPEAHSSHTLATGQNGSYTVYPVSRTSIFTGYGPPIVPSIDTDCPEETNSTTNDLTTTIHTTSTSYSTIHSATTVSPSAKSRKGKVHKAISITFTTVWKTIIITPSSSKKFTRTFHTTSTTWVTTNSTTFIAASSFSSFMSGSLTPQFIPTMSATSNGTNFTSPT